MIINYFRGGFILNENETIYLDVNGLQDELDELSCQFNDLVDTVSGKKIYYYFLCIFCTHSNILLGFNASYGQKGVDIGRQQCFFKPSK